MSPRPLDYVLVLALGASVVVACTPQERADAVEPTTRAACVLLRAFDRDGRLSEVCATAEELAPFVSELLAARVESPAPVSAPLVAFSMPVPARRAPRRRCALWVPVGAADAGADGAQ